MDPDTIDQFWRHLRKMRSSYATSAEFNLAKNGTYCATSKKYLEWRKS